jgi:hypothetical protein
MPWQSKAGRERQTGLRTPSVVCTCHQHDSTEHDAVSIQSKAMDFASSVSMASREIGSISLTIRMIREDLSNSDARLLIAPGIKLKLPASDASDAFNFYVASFSSVASGAPLSNIRSSPGYIHSFRMRISNDRTSRRHQDGQPDSGSRTPVELRFAVGENPDQPCGG